MNKFNQPGTPNNYTSIPYYLQATKIITHLDLVKFSVFDFSVYGIKEGKERELFKILKESNFNLVSDHWTKSGSKHERVIKFRARLFKTTLVVTYDVKDYYRQFRNMPLMMITIHDPIKEIVHWLDRTIDSFNYSTILNKVEFTVDFYENQIAIKKFFLNHLFLKNCRSGCQIVGEDPWDTYYIGNTRKDAKAIRIYLKPIDGGTVLRFELVMNRATIGRLGLELPLDKVNSVDLSKFISFKELNLKRLNDYISWKRRDEIKKIVRKKRELAGRSFQSSRWAKREGTLMEQVTRLKKSEYGRNNYLRFFDDLVDCNKAFFTFLNEKNFLP